MDTFGFFFLHDLGLVDLLRGPAQQVVGSDTKNIRQLRQHGDVGAGLVIFPFAHRLCGDTKLFSQRVLRQTEALAVFYDSFSQCLFHRNTSFDFLSISCHRCRKKAINYPLIWRDFLFNGWLMGIQRAVERLFSCICAAGAV